MAQKPICSIENCGKPSLARGWCSIHHGRWYRHGDPLAGRTKQGEPSRHYSEVLLTYEGDDCLIWPYARNEHGYGILWDDGRTNIVTRLLCEKVNGPPPTPTHQAAHSCGRGEDGCSTKAHLSWKTPDENAIDKISHGTHVRGARQNGAKLTEASVREMNSLKGTMSQRAIADLFGVSNQHVSRILSGKQWSWLDS